LPPLPLRPPRVLPQGHAAPPASDPFNGFKGCQFPFSSCLLIEEQPLSQVADIAKAAMIDGRERGFMVEKGMQKLCSKVV